ncbi:MAG: hypothetical protein HQL23_09700, partial [Candidatus Omnitrophica bacterium]|nr:hypothetical protein [Candidatus Omnitrophota bacterium]
TDMTDKGGFNTFRSKGKGKLEFVAPEGFASLGVYSAATNPYAKGTQNGKNWYVDAAGKMKEGTSADVEAFRASLAKQESRDREKYKAAVTQPAPANRSSASPFEKAYSLNYLQHSMANEIKHFGGVPQYLAAIQRNQELSKSFTALYFLSTLAPNQIPAGLKEKVAAQVKKQFYGITGENLDFGDLSDAQKIRACVISALANANPDDLGRAAEHVIHYFESRLAYVAEINRKNYEIDIKHNRQVKFTDAKAAQAMLKAEPFIENGIKNKAKVDADMGGKRVSVKLNQVENFLNLAPGQEVTYKHDTKNNDDVYFAEADTKDGHVRIRLQGNHYSSETGSATGRDMSKAEVAASTAHGARVWKIEKLDGELVVFHDDGSTSRKGRKTGFWATSGEVLSFLSSNTGRSAAQIAKIIRWRKLDSDEYQDVRGWLNTYINRANRLSPGKTHFWVSANTKIGVAMKSMDKDRNKVQTDRQGTVGTKKDQNRRTGYGPGANPDYLIDGNKTYPILKDEKVKIPVVDSRTGKVMKNAKGEIRYVRLGEAYEMSGKNAKLMGYYAGTQRHTPQEKEARGFKDDDLYDPMLPQGSAIFFDLDNARQIAPARRAKACKPIYKFHPFDVHNSRQSGLARLENQISRHPYPIWTRHTIYRQYACRGQSAADRLPR